MNNWWEIYLAKLSQGLIISNSSNAFCEGRMCSRFSIIIVLEPGQTGVNDILPTPQDRKNCYNSENKNLPICILYPSISNCARGLIVPWELPVFIQYKPRWAWIYGNIELPNTACFSWLFFQRLNWVMGISISLHLELDWNFYSEPFLSGECTVICE